MDCSKILDQKPVVSLDFLLGFPLLDSKLAFYGIKKIYSLFSAVSIGPLISFVQRRQDLESKECCDLSPQ